MPRFEIKSILDYFTPVSLNQMDSVALMNRVETKYLFPVNKLPILLEQLSENYKILEIDSSRTFPYNTTYLDTLDLLFYTQQVRGKLNRHKVRFRKYESTGESYLEVKKKTNQYRTIKWRIKNNSNAQSPDAKAVRFIEEYVPYYLPDLHPVLINRFNRITLVAKTCNERVTLDYNLGFGSPEGIYSEFPFLAIAELKRERNSCVSPFSIVMKRMGIKSGRFSKYCTGSALIMDMPRKNLLKYNMLLINKIENEYIDAYRS
jgi:hypothetical protein